MLHTIYVFQTLYPLMTSSSENIFRVTGPLWGESTGDWWIPLTKARDTELWSFLWSAPEQTLEQTIERPVIWEAIALIITSLLCKYNKDTPVAILSYFTCAIQFSFNQTHRPMNYLGWYNMQVKKKTVSLYVRLNTLGVHVCLPLSEPMLGFCYGQISVKSA